MLKFMLNCFSCKESNTLSNDMQIKQNEKFNSDEESKKKIETNVNMIEKPLELHSIQNVKNDCSVSEHSMSTKFTSKSSIVMVKSKDNSKKDILKAKRKVLLDECF